jgi:lipoate-protein ligase A
MAADEMLLEHVALLGRPVLRFYSWLEPAATFGYFQHYGDVAAMTPLRPLIRRPTGGGLVPHDADWTYSVAFPPGHDWHGLSATESYARVHAWIRDALARLRFATGLASARRVVAPGQCFAGAERFDLLCDDRKIAGAAQRRNRFGLLIQGSVQPVPAGVDRPDWETAMASVARDQWAVAWEPWSPAEGDRARWRLLAELKYAQDAYNRKR